MNRKLLSKAEQEWDRLRKGVSKPCKALEYCPYGPLVEQFPLLSPTREEAIAHNDYLKRQLEKEGYSGERKNVLEKEVKDFDAEKYPVSHPESELEKSCSVFGHQCPVFPVSEPLAETVAKDESKIIKLNDRPHAALRQIIIDWLDDGIKTPPYPPEYYDLIEEFGITSSDLTYYDVSRPKEEKRKK